MLLRTFVLIVAITFINSSILARRHPAQNQSFKKSRETYLARAIVQIYRGISKRYTKRDRSLFSKTSRLLRSSQTFQEFLPIVQDIKEFKTTRLSKKDLSYCFFTKEHSNDPIIKILATKLEKTCLRRIQNSKKEFSAEEIQFVLQNMRLFFGKDGAFIAKIFDNGLDINTTTELKNKTKEFILSKNAIPSKELLNHLDIDVELTQFLHDVNFFERKTGNYFNRELKSLIYKSRKQFSDDQFEEGKENLQASIQFLENNREYISSKRAWSLLITSGKKLARVEKFADAIDLFETTEELFEDDREHEAIFQTLYTRILDNDFPGAVSEIENRQLYSRFPELPNKLKYWISYTLEQSKEFKKAKVFYKRIIKENPLSFYSILSLQRLQDIQTDYPNNYLITDNNDIPLMKANQQGTVIFNRLYSFHLIGYTSFTNVLIKQIFNSDPEVHFETEGIEDTFSNASKAISLIDFLNNKGDHLNAFKVSYLSLNQEIIPLNRQVLSYLFPLKHKGYIDNKAKILDPHWVLSLIRQESAFNPKAKSHAGARGLMQLMPATARMFWKRMKIKDMYKEKNNLSIGIKYLENLTRKNEGNLIYTLASYNAGEGNLRKWKRSIFKSENPLVNLEAIPFKETRNYVKYIYRNYFFYKLLSGDQNRAFKFENDLFISLNNN